MWLTRFAIARPVIVAMATIALAIFGIKSYLSLGVSLFPNVAFPVVIVNATYPGAAPATMEKLIVKPIEDQLQGIEHLDQLTATAQEGVATVVVQFKLDTDLDFAATQVQQRVNAARGFMPSDLDPPTVLKNSSNSDPTLEEAVSSNTLSAAQIGDLVNNEIKPELESVPGVVNVAVRGDVGREFHVFPDLARLYGLGGTLLDVYNTIAPNNSTLPGGRMDTPTSETSVAVHADIVQAADMRRFPLPAPLVFPMPTSAERPSLGQVARIEDGHVEQRYPTRFNGASAVIIDVQRTVDADEVKTTADVRAAFAKLIVQYPRLHFREFQANADYTQASISGVMQSLLEGVALTAIVMLLFLHAWRNAVVVMIAIPTSLLATFGVMSLMGFTIDVISMMGMGLTIGILVDDSIVVLENIARHRDLGAAPLDAAYKGRTEIGSAAVTITLVDVVVFLPIAFLSGIVGKYMKEFGIVIVVATLFSLLVSFTLTPLLAGRWSMKKPELGIPRWAAWFTRGFDRLQNLYVAVILPWVLRRRLFIAFFCVLLVVNALSLAFAPRTLAVVDLIAALIFFVCSLVVKVLTSLGRLPGAASSQTRGSDFFMSGAVSCVIAGIMCFAPVLGGEFIPASDSGVLIGSVTFPAGTPLVVTATDLNRFASEATKIRDVASVITSGGVKVDGYSTTIGGNDGRITIVLDPTKRKATDRVLAAVRTLDWTFPGARFQISKIGGSGAGSPISYSISGPDSVLDETVGKVIALLRVQPGALNLQSSAESAAPRLDITIDPARAALVNVTPGDAATSARIAVGGVVATKVRTDTGLVNVIVQLPKPERDSLERIKELTVRAQDGTLVPLSQIATFTLTTAPTKIEREDRQRIVRVTGDIDSTTTLGTVLAPLNAALATPGFLPQGVKATTQGDSKLFAETMTSMLTAALTSFGLVYMLMVVLYGSFVEPFIVMFSVPVAIVGALGGLEIRHQTINLFSLIAVIMLLGLVAKNGILLVDYANQMRSKGMDVIEAMQTAAVTRFRPILMTTCAMVFGMLPLSLGLTEGAQERASMGTVLIGGLLSSLVLTLALVPVVYSWIMGWVEANERRKGRSMTSGRANADGRMRENW